MTTADLFNPAAPPEESRRAEFDVDYTPRAIPRTVFEALAPELGAVRRILIPAAGAGAWAAEARARWPDAHITAVEIRGEEQVNLFRWCQDVIPLDIRTAAPLFVQPFDLIADNPPFSMLPISFDCDHPVLNKSGDRCAVCKARKSQAETMRAFVVNLRPLLAPGGRLALYHVSQLGQRGKESAAILREHVPLYQMRHQPVAHRSKGGTDSKSYSTWVWPAIEDKGDAPEGYAVRRKPGGAGWQWGCEITLPDEGPEDGWDTVAWTSTTCLTRQHAVDYCWAHRNALAVGNRSWQTWDMPALPAHERRWSVVPGTEAT